MSTGESTARDFQEMWDFPNCVGAIDGKHVAVQNLPNGGSELFNYKGYYSIMLLADCDARDRFLKVHIEEQGQGSDVGIFQNTDFGAQLASRCLDIPQPKKLPKSSVQLVHVIVGDEAFPLLLNLMRPYPGK
ncbi:uncharacterized protein LOC135384316 [Ornithodoros turicata]|uniref:uncharacterized protein LOC135384316 n=1 Tax=Ornithodoros turicata TaxID=34597 RepID=UPI00313A12F0